jgi:hypothetical protein
MKTKKGNIILLAAVAVSFMSCVDDAVSPQVEAIRAQQVEFMKAKTGTEAALARFKDAETAYKIALAANETAMTAANVANQAALTALTKEQTNGLVNTNIYNQSLYSWLLKLKEEEYKDAVAKNALNLKTLEVALKQAELAYQTSQKVLADAVAATKDKNAADYFTNYKTEADNLYLLYNAKTQADTDIAANNLLLAYETNISANFTAKQKLKIADTKLELKAQEASLKSLELLAGNPADLDDKIEALKLANYNIDKQKASKNIELTKAIAAVTQVGTDDAESKAIIEKMIGIDPTKLGYQANLLLAVKNIDSEDQKVKTLSAEISELKIMLSEDVKDLANRRAAFIVEKANYDSKYSLWQTAVLARTNAQTTYYDAFTLQKVAANNNGGYVDSNGVAQGKDDLLGNPTVFNVVGPLYTEYQAKKGAADNLLAQFEIKNIDANKAYSLVELAKKTLDNTTTNVSGIETDINNKTIAINAKEKSLQDSKDKIAVNSDKQTFYLKAIADLKPSFEKAILDVNKSFEVTAAKQKIVDAIQDEIDALDVTFTENNALKTSLENSKTTYFKDVTGLVTAKKAQIVATNSAIDVLEKSIVDVNGSELKAKAAVIKLIAEDKQLLATLAIKIAAAERQVKYWKDLLDKIFTV